MCDGITAFPFPTWKTIGSGAFEDRFYLDCTLLCETAARNEDSSSPCVIKNSHLRKERDERDYQRWCFYEKATSESLKIS